MHYGMSTCYILWNIRFQSQSCFRLMPMHIKFNPYQYEELNSRQQEAYNFQKVSAVLADYGFVTIRLSSDWQGADFIAQEVDGKFLKVQLKGRLTLDKKYEGKDLYICFPTARRRWYIYPHDELMNQILGRGLLKGTKSWDTKGIYHYPGVPKDLETLLDRYRLEEVLPSEN